MLPKPDIIHLVVGAGLWALSWLWVIYAKVHFLQLDFASFVSLRFDIHLSLPHYAIFPLIPSLCL